MENTKITKETALFIGITSGFAFLVSFFAGIGVSPDKVFLAAIFFAIVAIAVGIALFARPAAKRNY